MVNNIDPGETKTMASFLFAGKSTTPSVMAARHSLLELMVSVGGNFEKAVHNQDGDSDGEDAEHDINSIADFRDFPDQKPESLKNSKEFMKSKNKKQQVQDLSVSSNDS